MILGNVCTRSIAPSLGDRPCFPFSLSRAGNDGRRIEGAGILWGCRPVSDSIRFHCILNGLPSLRDCIRAPLSRKHRILVSFQKRPEETRELTKARRKARRFRTWTPAYVECFPECKSFVPGLGLRLERGKDCEDVSM